MNTPPVLKSSEAIFAVRDVLETVKFHREVLGFEEQMAFKAA